MRNLICDPNVQLQGRTVQAFLQSIMHSDFAHILEDHGLHQDIYPKRHQGSEVTVIHVEWED
jgi:hypothetical protein